MQTICFTRVVTKKKKAGYLLPIDLLDAFDALAETRGNKKEKWRVVGAALTMFMAASEDEQNDWIREVTTASLPGGSFERLIVAAKMRGKNSRRMPAIRDESGELIQPRKEESGRGGNVARARTKQ